MTTTGNEVPAETETATGNETGSESGNRWWIGAAIVAGVPLMVLNAVSNAARFGDGFLSHWWGQAVVGSGLLLGYALVHWMISRAYRRHRAVDGAEGVR